MTFRDRLSAFRNGLTRTRNAMFGQIAALVGASDVTDDTWDELEATFIQADMGVHVAVDLIEELRTRARDQGVIKAADFNNLLRLTLRERLIDPPPLHLGHNPSVLLMVGVNGSGKTTTTAKLAKKLAEEHSVKPLLAACDTFRAAAVEQLKVWGDRLNVPVVSAQPGADPAAVLYDAIQSAQARGFDLVIADTAGRLHTKFNLMEELKKVYRVAGKAAPGAPHDVLLVLDSTTGQNALQQARAFKEAVQVSGIVLTKMDGSAKGGMAFSIYPELNLPIQYIGFGETAADLRTFDPDAFIAGLLTEP